MVVMTHLAINFSAPVRPRGPSARAESGPAEPISLKDGRRESPPEVYMRDEQQRLLDGLLGRNEKVRIRALYVVMWRAGLRVRDPLDLHVGDLRPEGTPSASAAPAGALPMRNSRPIPIGRRGPK